MSHRGLEDGGCCQHGPSCSDWLCDDIIKIYAVLCLFLCFLFRSFPSCASTDFSDVFLGDYGNHRDECINCRRGWEEERDGGKETITEAELKGYIGTEREGAWNPHCSGEYVWCLRETGKRQLSEAAWERKTEVRAQCSLNEYLIIQEKLSKFVSCQFFGALCYNLQAQELVGILKIFKRSNISR